MGDIIGGLIGGVGDIIGSSEQADAQKKAAQAALTGYNYLTKGAGADAQSGFINNGSAANTASAQLLGLSPITSQTQNGFNNYLNSTGYNFQLKQGIDAISGNAAAKGILNSGATAKALQTYGQGLASTTFNNYLGQLNTQAGMGQSALGQTAAAGSAGGNAAAAATAAAGNATAAGTSGALGQFTNAFQQIPAFQPGGSLSASTLFG